MKIITHNGIFHADEIFAITIIKQIWNITQIIRTRDKSIIDAGIQDNDCIIVDVGRIFDVSKFCFDHHQDENLPSSAGLLWDTLGWIVSGNNRTIEKNIRTNLIQAIDMWDTNKDDIHQRFSEFNNSGMMNISILIKGFNRDPTDDEEQLKQFYLALDMASSILENAIAIAKANLEDLNTWNNRKQLDNGVLIFDKYCTVWRAKVKEENLECYFAVLPNPEGYMISAFDTNIRKLPAISHEDLKFLHNGKFLAVFKTKESAIEIAEAL